jgi:hypothetical protein
MKAHRTIVEPVKPQANVAMMFGTSTPHPPDSAREKPPQTARPARSAPPAQQKEADQARERRRHDAHHRNSWHHGGINE